MMVAYDMTEWSKGPIPGTFNSWASSLGHSTWDGPGSWHAFVRAMQETPRTFRIFYPEVKAVGEVTVRLMPGETPEQAIRREGDTFRDTWIFMEEVRTW